MKNLIILSFCTVVLSFNIFAQNSIEKTLLEVEKNNTMLAALRKNVEAEKLGNKTGIYLQNPMRPLSFSWASRTWPIS